MPAIWKVKMRAMKDTFLMNYPFPKPKESGMNLSDILQPPEEVSQKYFLSEKAVSTLMKYNERQEQNGRGFRAEFTKENEIKSALKVGGGQVNDLVQVGNIDTKGHNSIWGRVYDPKGIATTLTDGGGMGAKTGLYCVASRGRGKENKQTLEARKDGMTNSLTSVEKDNLIICEKKK